MPCCRVGARVPVIFLQALDFADVSPSTLDLLVVNDLLAPILGFAVLQWIQWEKREEARPSDRSVRTRALRCIAPSD